MISVSNVTKQFGRIKAVNQVSFDISEGEIVGFLGPNGAGKTTLMRLLVGVYPPTSGKVLIENSDLFKHKSLRRQIGYLAEHNPLYGEMTTLEFLKYVAFLKGLRWRKKKDAIKTVMEQCDLDSVAQRMIGKLSKGFRQRIGLAQALLGSPKVLVLDEPTNGLDPEQIIQIRNLILSLKANHTIILSTHILPEVQVTCSRVLIMNLGKLIASGTPQDLNQNLSQFEEFVVRLRGPWKEGDHFLRTIPEILGIELERENANEREYKIRTKKGSQFKSQIARLIMEAGYELLELKTAELSLEEVFLKLVRQEKEVELCQKS